jgi:hypothetical protein
MMDNLFKDIRFAWRGLLKHPGFTAIAVIILALGIAATTAAFSVTDFVLIRPLPFREPDRLVMLLETTPGYVGMELSAPNYRDWKGAATSFESLSIYTTSAATMTGGTEPRRLNGATSSAELLVTLGVAPTIGRSFTADDEREGAARVVALEGVDLAVDHRADLEQVGAGDAPFRVDRHDAQQQPPSQGKAGDRRDDGHAQPP